MTGKKERKPRQRSKAGSRRARTPKPQEIHHTELAMILERAKSAPLSAEDHDKLKAAMDTLVFLTQELEAKGASIRRLRKLIFGSSTEKTDNVLGGHDPAKPNRGGDATAGKDKPDADNASGTDTPDEASGAEPQDDDGDKQPAQPQSEGESKPEGQDKPKPGHGRNGAAAYTGAERVAVPHESLKPCMTCPACLRGKVYSLPQPARLVRVKGMAPLAAEIYELERLRCNLCGEVFTAAAPEGVSIEKYDESAGAMIGLLKYGTGFPFNRIQRLQQDLGMPMPASTQWGIVRGAAQHLRPAFDEHVRQAAQGKVLYNDDTTMRVLELDKRSLEAADAEEESEKRTGVFTTGIVSTNGNHQIALFLTGRKHAGENIADVLSQRAAELPPPIQMCDALSRNTTNDFETLLANCLAHARRYYVDVVDNFPSEVRHVLETLREVYRNDATTKNEGMSPEERLEFHKKHSGPLMDALKEWCQEQFQQRKVEPNSGLGQAIAYMTKHWEKLTLFLRVAGAPLDNNVCERILKKAILHRKNSLFYKTLNGARVGDIFMTLIHTAELAKVNVFHYLVTLLRHHELLAEQPADFMPWNYTEALARLAKNPD